MIRYLEGEKAADEYLKNAKCICIKTGDNKDEVYANKCAL